MLTPDFLQKLNYQDRLDLLANPSFIDASTLQGLNPADVLELSSFTRADRCVQPVVLTKVDVHSGEAVDVALPCGTSDAQRCASCAEYLQRLRQKQIFEGLTVEGTQAALMTLTAPSFGQVHRATFSAKDMNTLKSVLPHKRDVLKRIIQSKNGRCGCGKHHDFTDDIVGTPRGEYDYIGEVLWSHNLPKLVKSTMKRLRYLAKREGIDPDAFGVFSVYERQKRGSIHLHALLTVRDDPDGFSRLMASLKQGWVSPTAQIDALFVEYLERAETQKRFDATGVGSAGDVKSSIPHANWKKGKSVPATKFGEVFDVQILSGNPSSLGEISTSKKAADYIAKYLTKTQSAFSVENIRRLPRPTARHYSNLRLTAIALLADKTFYEYKLAHAQNEIRKIPALFGESNRGKKRLRQLKKHLRRIKRKGILGTPLPNTVSSRMSVNGLYASYLFQDLDMNTVGNVRVSSRGMRIRLNHIANNAGFSGSLTSISKWRSTLRDLKQRVKDWATKTFGQVAQGSLLWRLNPEGMTEERKRRFRKR